MNFALRIAKQSPGYLINRHPPDDLGLEPIYPEFRPTNALRTDDRPHEHLHLRDGMSPQKGIVPARFVIYGKSLREHVNQGSIRGFLYDASGFCGVQQNIKTPAGELVTEHCGMDCWYVHEHVSWAKYVFPIGGRIVETRWHDNQATWHVREGRSEKWIAKHVAEKHAGSEQAWYGQEHKHPDSYDIVLSHAALAAWHKKAMHIKYDHKGSDLDVVGKHRHDHRVKDTTLQLARRLDVHPDAMAKIRKAEVVFFVIEGCMKADSILAKDGAVFSVPSVSLWDCNELEAFARTYLKDREVVIVPDADWIVNREVVSQARLCHATLIQYDVKTVHIAAPPLSLKAPVTTQRDWSGYTYRGKAVDLFLGDQGELQTLEWHGYPYRGKGVDDFLGDEGQGQLAELQTIDFYLSRETKASIKRILRRSTRIEQVSRNGKVLESLAIFAGPTGELPSSLEMVARATGYSRQRVTVAVKQLKEWGVLDYEGDLKERLGYWTGKLEWSDAPPIIIAEQYRAHEAERHQLGDVVIGSLTTP